MKIYTVLVCVYIYERVERGGISETCKEKIKIFKMLSIVWENKSIIDFQEKYFCKMQVKQKSQNCKIWCV